MAAASTVVAGVGELRSGERSIEGRGVDEGLKDGAGGTVSDGMIELRGAVAAAAHQREHLAGMRVERHQRDLRVVAMVSGCFERLRRASTSSSTFFMPSATACVGDFLQIGIE